MEALIHISIYGITGLVLLIMTIDHLRGRVDALSIRNVSLVGFLIFMVLSARGGLVFDPGSSYNLADPVATVGKWMMWCAAFLVVFFFVYARGFGAKAVAARLPVPVTQIGIASGWPLMVVLLIAAGLLRLVPIPLVSALAGLTAVGLASVAAGIAGWVWAPRLFNPVVAAPALAVVAAAAFIANFGEFGRRPLVSVGACLIWGMYYSSFRHKSLPSMAARVAIVAIPPMILFSLYSSVRSWSLVGSTDIVTQMFERGDATQSLEEISSQDTARIGQWLMEYADRGTYETRMLFSVQYFVMYPIPRALFDAVGAEKPWPISTQMADLSNRTGVKRGNTGVTNPAGIIGNAIVEGGIIAIIVYASVLALLFRLADDYIRRNPYAPFLVLPLGSSLGQVMGIARGESSVFTFAFVWTTLTVTFTMIAASAVLSSLFPQLAAADESLLEPPEDADSESANADYAWYDETEYHPNT